MLRVGGREITLSIACGEMQVTLNAEGVSWSPDVASDMVTRAVQAFREVWEIAGEFAVADESDETASADEAAGDASDS